MRAVTLAGRARTESTSLFYLPRLRLFARRGSCAGEVVHVDGDGLTIGREGALSLCTQGVSRRHAVLRYTNGVFSIADLNSRNGTFLNGVRVVESPVQPGDLIEIAEHCFEVELGAPEDDALPSTKGAPMTAAVGGVTSAFRIVPASDATSASAPAGATSPPPAPRPTRRSRVPKLFVRPARRGGLESLRTPVLVVAGCLAIAGAGLALRSVLAGRGPQASSSASAATRVLVDGSIRKRDVPAIPVPPSPVAVGVGVEPAAIVIVRSPSLGTIATPSISPSVADAVSPAHHHHHHRHDGPVRSRGGVDLSSEIDTDDVDALREMHSDVALRYSEARRDLRDGASEQLEASELAARRQTVNDLGRRDRALRVLIDELVANQEKAKMAKLAHR